MFNEEVIRTMFERNSDGAGIMYLTPNGLVHIEKGFFSVEKMLAYINKNAKQLAKTDVVLHFRIATSGKKNAVGCHPYPIWSKNVSDSCDVSLAMAHNGVLDNCGWKGTDDVNDTENFIRETLRKLPHNFYKNKAIMDLISKSIAHNKLAFLSKDGITTVGDFIEDNGYLFSNTTYKKINYPTYTSNYAYRSFQPVVKSVTTKNDKEITKKTIDTIFGDKDEITLTPKSYKVIENYFKTKGNFRKLENDWNEDSEETYYDDENIYVLNSRYHIISKSCFGDDETTIPLF